MARTTEQILATLPKARRDRIRAMAAEMIAEVEGLQAVRKLAGLSQRQIAEQLGVKQPTVHRMENGVDIYLSTLERFVEAAGGEIEVKVMLPGHAPVRFRRLSEIVGKVEDDTAEEAA